MWALVTGGAKRLGASICVALAQKNYSVVVHYKESQKEAEKVAEKCRLYGVQAEILSGDFSTFAGVEEFIDQYQQKFTSTKILINNVGNYFLQSAMQTEAKDWIDLFQTNLHAPFRISQALVPSLIENEGKIINMGVSGLTNIRANTQCPAYYLSKLSLLGFTQSLAKELASQKVQVNMISPGYLENAVDLPKDWNKIPMHRPATCLEVCQMITFLIDPLNAYITGQNIEIAGGVGL